MTLLLLNTPVQTRRRFVNNTADIVGRSNVRVCYVPDAREGLVVPDAVVGGRNWTHSATPTGRLTQQGKGTLLTFSTAEYLTTPDAADLSFGDGANDAASGFGIFFVGNVTDSAALRRVVSKWTGVSQHEEWSLSVNATDQLQTQLNTFTLDITINSVSAITQGQLKSWASTYIPVSAVGSRANDIAHYENGVASAMTPTNSASYIAMQDSDADVRIGGRSSDGLQPYVGQMGTVLVFISPTAAKVAQLHPLVRDYYRMAA